jgi:hypothetical protein
LPRIVPASADFRKSLRFPARVSTSVVSAAASTGFIICQRPPSRRSTTIVVLSAPEPRSTSIRRMSVTFVSINSGKRRLSIRIFWSRVGTSA